MLKGLIHTDTSECPTVWQSAEAFLCNHSKCDRSRECDQRHGKRSSHSYHAS